MALQCFPSIAKSTKLGDGTNYAYVSVPSSKSTFLLLHGFPSSSYDWRHQIESLERLGYGIIAPDLLGYGGTDKPNELQQYRFKNMAAHIAEILQIEGQTSVIGVAHDWGAWLLSRMANYYPELFRGFVFVVAPYMEPIPFDLDAASEMTKQAFGYSFFGYWTFFNEIDAADVCDRNPSSVTSLLYPPLREDLMSNIGPPGTAKKWIYSGETYRARPSWLSDSEMQVHDQIFRAGGYHGPLNWYKSVIRGNNDEEYAKIPEEQKILHQPILFVHSDEVFSIGIANMMVKNPNLRKVKTMKVDGCGHWLQLEKKDELLNFLIEFEINI